MHASDRAVGTVGFALSVLIYIYYTAWVLITPFVDEKIVWFHSLFPNRWWAFAVPTALLVVALTVVVTFVGIVSLRAK
tara:strand:+ start:527 stop:760 length:234 start_codon:yes stop_codon:yes gene_type:complete